MKLANITPVMSEKAWQEPRERLRVPSAARS